MFPLLFSSDPVCWQGEEAYLHPGAAWRSCLSRKQITGGRRKAPTKCYIFLKSQAPVVKQSTRFPAEKLTSGISSPLLSRCKN